MPGPLSGLRVLELARILAGPWAGQVLADVTALSTADRSAVHGGGIAAARRGIRRETVGFHAVVTGILGHALVLTQLETEAAFRVGVTFGPRGTVADALDDDWLGRRWLFIDYRFVAHGHRCARVRGSNFPADLPDATAGHRCRQRSPSVGRTCQL